MAPDEPSLGLRLSLRRRAPARAREIIEEFPLTADLRLDSLGRSERLVCPITTARTIVSMLTKIDARPSGADVELPTGESRGFLGGPRTLVRCKHPLCVTVRWAHSACSIIDSAVAGFYKSVEMLGLGADRQILGPAPSVQLCRMEARWPAPR